MSGLFEQLVLHSAGLALAALCAGLLLRSLRSRPASAYRVVFVTCMAALTVPVLGLGAGWVAERLPRGSSASPAAEERPLLPAGEKLAGSPHASPTTFPSPVAASSNNPPLRTGTETPDGPPEGASPPPEIPAWALVLPWVERSTRGVESSARSIVAHVPRVPETLRSWLVGAWLTGALLGLARLGLRWLSTTRMVARAQPVRDPLVLDAWAELERSQPGARLYHLVETEELQAPACFGLIRPVVLLPARRLSGTTAEELACTLLHECVHLERRDPWMLFTQELFGCLYWFHPGARWLTRQLTELRELACDSLVVQRTGRRKSYAQALLRYADRLATRRSPRAASLLSWTTSRHQLTRRIEMLVSTTPKPGTRKLLLRLGSLLLVSSWASQVALATAFPAQSAAPEPTPAANPLPPAQAASPTRATPLAEPRPAQLPAWQAPLASTTPPGGAGLPRNPLPPARVQPPSGAGFALPTRAPSASGRAGLARQNREERGFHLGVRLGSAPPVLAAQFDYSPERLLVIESVTRASAAQEAGLQPWDVIYAIDGEPATWDALQAAKLRLANEREVELGVFRHCEPRTLIIDSSMGEGPDARDHMERLPRGISGLRPDYREQKERERALQAYNEALRQAPSRSPQGTLEQALRYYDGVDTGEYRKLLGRAYAELGREGRADEGAREALRELLERTPDELEEYLDQVRGQLRDTDVEDFQKQLQGFLHERDEAARRADQKRAQRDFEAQRHEGEQRSYRDERNADREARIHDARRELEHQAQELQRLREELSRLEELRGRKSGGLR